MHTQILAISFKIEAISFTAQRQCVISLIHFNQLNYRLGYTMIILVYTIVKYISEVQTCYEILR